MRNAPRNDRSNTLIAGRLFTGSFLADSHAIIPARILSVEEVCALSKADYMALRTRGSWVKYLASATIGSGLHLAAKYVTSLFTGEAPAIPTYEYVAPCLGLAIAAFLFFAERPFLSERRKVMKRLKRHFDNARPSLFASENNDHERSQRDS